MEIVIYVVLAILISLFILIVITPANKNGKLNKVFQGLHDFFNFKKIYIIIILKALIIFLTVLSVIVGFRMLFGFRIYGYHYNTFGYGLLLIILGPFVIRIAYELLWLTINSAQAVIQIRDKMYDRKESYFDTNFDEQLNAAEKFGNKVYKDTKKFSSDAFDAANKKINEMKENKQNKQENKENDHSQEEKPEDNNKVNNDN